MLSLFRRSEYLFSHFVNPLGKRTRDIRKMALADPDPDILEKIRELFRN
jgi:hypothetical protein